MFLDWKNQDCENEYDIQSNLRFNANTIKLPMAFFMELKQPPPICIEIPKKTLKCQSNLEKEKWS